MRNRARDVYAAGFALLRFANDEVLLNLEGVLETTRLKLIGPKAENRGFHGLSLARSHLSSP
jgi:very-short-patch-repair endonuclease